MKRLNEAFGVTLTFLNAWDGFGKRFLARLAPESSFTNGEEHAVTSNGVVLDANKAMVIGTYAWGCTFRTILSLGFLLAFIARAEAIFADGFNEFELGEEDKI